MSVRAGWWSRVGVKLILVAVAAFTYGILYEIVKSYMTGRQFLISVPHVIGSIVASAVILAVLVARLLTRFRVDIQGVCGTFVGAWMLCATALAGLTTAQADWFNYGLIDLVVDASFVILAALVVAVLARRFCVALDEE